MAPTLHGYRKLQSGDLSLLYRNGEIRQVCLDRIQVLNAIYAAVRDQNWTTIPFTVSSEIIEEKEDGFKIKLNLSYSLGKIYFNSIMSIEAKGNKLHVNFDGEAKSSFLRNRIGLCILHPIKECRGRTVLIIHPDGSTSEGLFPELISPDQPFFNISGMSWKPTEGLSANLSFLGDIFEAEDQRNWTDSSYKTYSTPLELPFPLKVEKGDQIHQSVSLVVEKKAYQNKNSSKQMRILSILPGETLPLPALGLERSAEEQPMTREEAALLSTLPFHHYRVDLHIHKKEWKMEYLAAAREQNLLGWPLELALHFGVNPEQEVNTFLEQYIEQPLNICNLLVFDQDFLSPGKLLEKVIPRIRESLPQTLVGGGTDANFAELNRNPPDTRHLDFISYSICPQVHAFDNLTLVENLEAQPDSVSSARKLLSKPVSIGAISLKQRFNAVATDDNNNSQALPESDSRQHTNFIAGWTLGSLRSLAMARPASLTYFETVGPRGILSRKDDPVSNAPLFHLFKEVLSNEQKEVIRTTSSHPLEFDCLAMRGQRGSLLFIANYSESELSIEIDGMPGPPQDICVLDENGWTLLKNAEPEMRFISLNPFKIYKISFSV